MGMTVSDINKMAEKINLFSTITKNYASNNEEIEKPVIVIKGVANTDVELERSKATDTVIYALYGDLIELRKKYDYILKVMKEDFNLELTDLIEKYSTEKYLSDFKDALNASREKENGASLTFIVTEDSDGEKPDTTMCTIKLKDIFEKNSNYLIIEDMINTYNKKINNPHYIQAVNWLKNHDLETLEVPEEISDKIDSMVGIEKEEEIDKEEAAKVAGADIDEEEPVILKRNPDGSFS